MLGDGAKLADARFATAAGRLAHQDELEAAIARQTSGRAKRGLAETPTAAGANDVANAILDGSDAVMLSGETARGAHPVESVRVMATIARQVEAAYPHEELWARRLTASEVTVETSIAGATVTWGACIGGGSFRHPAPARTKIPAAAQLPV